LLNEKIGKRKEILCYGWYRPRLILHHETIFYHVDCNNAPGEHLVRKNYYEEKITQF